MIRPKFLLNIICLLAMMAGCLCSCTDDLIYDNGDYGDGEAEISAEVAFKPLAGALESRSAGDAIRTISTLTVVMYDNKGNLYRIEKLSAANNNLVIDATGNTEMPSDTDPTTQSEATTAKATFTLKNVPFGRYTMYAVANMDVTEEMAETPAILKSQVVEWDESNVSNNCQMFGYFTEENQGLSSGFSAPYLKINKSAISLHCWVKRLASKLTIAFDTDSLHNGIQIYIHKVSVKNISKYSYLGKTFKADADSLIEVDSASTNPAQVLFCNSQGFSTTTGDTGSAYTNWWRLIRRRTLYGSHSESAPSLYFYENCQGDFEDYPNKEYFDKRQNPDSVGTAVGEGDGDYRDNVPNGTYVEVEGYYIANVESSGYQSAGKIIYRFMLGNNVTYNYDVERNHHYKLTMKFRGYANQVDWHIEYPEYPPRQFMSKIFYVSYSYNQLAMFPVRTVGNVTKIEATILENNWAPCDTLEDGTITVPDNIGNENTDPADRFLWNRQVYFGTGGVESVNGVNHPYLGFLSLSAPGDGETLPTHIFTDLSFSAGQTAWDYLKNYYEGKGGYRDDVNYNPQNHREYEVTAGMHDNGYNQYTVSVSPATQGEKSTIVQIPFLTRPKNMISFSGFSGNNPYDAYRRYARVEIKSTFMDGTILRDTVQVFQVRRLVNPKAVWRDWNNTDPFYVRLLDLLEPTSRFDPYISIGSWKAYINVGNDMNFLKLSPGVESYQRNDTIYGDQDTEIEFYLNFSGLSDRTQVDCAIVTVEYNGFTCNHRIFVRQGYDQPLSLNEDDIMWSSYNLFSTSGTLGEQTKVLDATLCINPLSMGSYFKRGNYNQGILASNNATYGPLDPIGSNALNLTNGSSASWDNIGAQNPPDGFNPSSSTSTADTWHWADFKTEVNGVKRQYRVPTLDDFNSLKDCDFGFGVVYGDGATYCRTLQDDAYYFNDYENTALTSDRGVRACVVYNPENANNVIFPLGAYGMGRRLGRLSDKNYGYLRYADVAVPLTVARSANNYYRPIPYDLPASPGALYWIWQVVMDGHPEPDKNYPSAAWDINYFDLNFNPYTANCIQYSTGLDTRSDALPIKLIYVKDLD